jgi:uncharacterized protein YneF (UPF0154 family)
MTTSPDQQPHGGRGMWMTERRLFVWVLLDVVTFLLGVAFGFWMLPAVLK